jgi:hypothetical protein
VATICNHPLQHTETLHSVRRVCFVWSVDGFPTWRRVPGSIPVQIIWDVWWTRWHWGEFSQSISVSLSNSHSTNCYSLIILPSTLYSLGTYSVVKWQSSFNSSNRVSSILAVYCWTSSSARCLAFWRRFWMIMDKNIDFWFWTRWLWRVLCSGI